MYRRAPWLSMLDEQQAAYVDAQVLMEQGELEQVVPREHPEGVESAEKDAGEFDEGDTGAVGGEQPEDKDGDIKTTPDDGPGMRERHQGFGVLGRHY